MLNLYTLISLPPFLIVYLYYDSTESRKLSQTRIYELLWIINDEYKLLNYIQISPYYFPRHIHGNYFCWGFAASFSLLRAFKRRTLQLRWRQAHGCGTLNTVKFSIAARSRVVSTSAANFSSLIYGCLKYKNKEKRKTGLRFELWLWIMWIFHH